LSGFNLPLPLPLPDGSVPDVLRVSSSSLGIFIGDAKHSESPNNFSTYQRLQKYAKWITPPQKRAEWRSVFSVCHGDGDMANQWTALLLHLAASCDLPLLGYGIKPLAEDVIISWALVGVIEKGHSAKHNNIGLLVV
jgi:hypothetical protein